MSRLVVVLLCIACVASADAQDSSGTAARVAMLSSGDTFTGGYAGYSWFSPRGAHWGLVTGRRIYQVGWRTEWVEGTLGQLAIAPTFELPLVIVQRTRRQGLDCLQKNPMTLT